MIILDQLPPTTNGAYRISCRSGFAQMYLTAEAKAFKEEVGWLAKKLKCTDKPVKLEIWFYHKNKRRKDIDGSIKILMDSLNGYAYEDDSQVEELVVHKWFAKKEQTKIEITILI